MNAYSLKFAIWRALPAVVLAGGAAMVFAAIGLAQTGATQSMASKAKAAAVKPPAASVHQSAIVIDTHADTPQRFLDEHYDLGDALKGGEFNLEAAKKGGLGAEFFSIWVEPDQFKGHYARRTLELIDAVRVQAAKHPKEMELVTSAEGIERAHREHKLAALMGIEGGHSIED